MKLHFLVPILETTLTDFFFKTKGMNKMYMIEEIRQTTAIVVEEYQKMRRVFSSESTKKLVGWNLALNKKKEANVGILVCSS